MILATEYLLRNNRLQNLLKLPCSIFLTNKEDGSKLILSIHKIYGDLGNVIIRHWNLCEDNVNFDLPPNVEFKIKKEEIFTSKNVVMKDYEILEYKEEPYETGGRQFAESPQALFQENEYVSCLDSFYNNRSHQKNKTNWLWVAFERKHVLDNVKSHYNHDNQCEKDLQRDIVQYFSRVVWKSWLHWRKHLLDFPSPISPELIFKNYYIPRESPNRFIPTIWTSTGMPTACMLGLTSGWHIDSSDINHTPMYIDNQI
jgi:hypothetical protein